MTIAAPMTRKQAKALGLKKYMPASPCRRGHLALRKINGACCECSRINGRALYQKKIHQYRASARHREKKRRLEKPANFRNRMLIRTYGITLEQYADMFQSQGLRCAICNTEDPGKKGVFPVDHDHNSGKIRGILCTNCNTGLGRFKDNIAFLESVSAYLRRTQ